MAPPASAGQSRTAGFTFVCDGQPKQTTVAFTGFTANQTTFTLCGRIHLYQQQGRLQYVVLSLSGTQNANIAIVAGGGSPTDHRNNKNDTNFTNVTLPANAHGAGIVHVDIIG